MNATKANDARFTALAHITLPLFCEAIRIGQASTVVKRS
jgi:hypothetical protein